MKTKHIAVTVALLLVVAPVTTFALTADEVQAKIQALLAQIAELTAQIRALQAETRGEVVSTVAQAITGAGFKHRVCALLKRNLSEGVEGDDVRGLQEFLQSEGYLAVAPTGYFGALTREALARWQASQGVVASADARGAGAGLLGPKTRERIKFWCGLSGEGGGMNTERFNATPSSGEAPLTVTFSTWLSGFRVPSISYTIDFGDGTSERAADCPAPADACTGPGQNMHTYTQNGMYTAVLYKDDAGGCGPNADPRCLGAPARRTVVAKAQIHVGQIACTKEYMPVCGSKQVVCITTPCNPIPTTYSNRCQMSADGATFLYEGQCRSENPADDPQCKQWFDGCNTCSRTAQGGIAACTLKYCTPGTTQKPYCSARFDHTGNKPPVISSFSGPTTLAEDATGTWTITASDPEGGALTYQVWWGDENIYASNYTTATAAHEFTQSTTFTHIYSNAGTYTVKVTVRDSGGQEARASSTVKVTPEGVACVLQYDPVCGRPAGCANTCAQGAVCTMECRPHDPITYSNRCFLDAAGASVIHEGACQPNWHASCAYEGKTYVHGEMSTSLISQRCCNGTWVATSNATSPPQCEN